MNGFVRGLFRWALVVAIGVVTFWPGWGLMWLGMHYFWASPLITTMITALALAWIIVLALALPLSLRVFQAVSSVSISGIFGVLLYETEQTYPEVVQSQNPLVWGMVLVFVVFGWIMVSAPLWRAVRGVVVVQQVHEHDHQD